ncbi:MAG: FKBP-type peptidyl-prolyl cis-trans isomerase [Verrucomicrobiota bacterium]|nr:FKBP-type peptidyl-prolyl cis-trans isomerase [Verrucomicrobiota bacterium]
MKLPAIAALTLGLTFTAAAQTDKATLKTDQEKAAYSIGFRIGSQMKSQGVEISQESLASGIKDALGGNPPALSDSEMEQAIMGMQKTMMAKMEAKGAEAKKAGEAFLAENKKKEGIKTTASGLQYKVIKEGTGPKPTAEDTVSTHYKGTLVDGKEFDSSKGEPVTFPVKGVIPGWTEALQLMPVGSKWQLFIPSDLAYGERGAGGAIPPNSTLIFDIELVEIKK